LRVLERADPPLAGLVLLAHLELVLGRDLFGHGPSLDRGRLHATHITQIPTGFRAFKLAAAVRLGSPWLGREGGDRKRRLQTAASMARAHRQPRPIASVLRTRRDTVRRVGAPPMREGRIALVYSTQFGQRCGAGCSQSMSVPSIRNATRTWARYSSRF